MAGLRNDSRWHRNIDFDVKQSAVDSRARSNTCKHQQFYSKPAMLISQLSVIVFIASELILFKSNATWLKTKTVFEYSLGLLFFSDETCSCDIHVCFYNQTNLRKNAAVIKTVTIINFNYIWMSSHDLLLCRMLPKPKQGWYLLLFLSSSCKIKEREVSISLPPLPQCIRWIMNEAWNIVIRWRACLWSTYMILWRCTVVALSNE